MLYGGNEWCVESVVVKKDSLKLNCGEAVVMDNKWISPDSGPQRISARSCAH